MGFVQVNTHVIINAEHISYIMVSSRTPKPSGPHAHQYPVLFITMTDGKCYEIERRHDSPIDDSPFHPFGDILNRIANA